MKTINFFLSLAFILTSITFGYSQDVEVKEVNINKYIRGDLYQPIEASDKLAIIVGGSGATDRNGNQAMIKTDTYKKLASHLAKNNIACFTYDKRILRMNEIPMKESELRFEDLVTDLLSVIGHFSKGRDYNDIVLIGHSQGSLVSLIALRDKGDAFISIAGAGEPIDDILVEQIGKQAPQLKEELKAALKKLKENGKVEDYPPSLSSLLRPSVQPFIRSWMQYDPKEMIANIEKPILILNGDQDIQVSADQARKLKKAQPDARSIIIENMNHVLKESKDKGVANRKTYQNPELPLVDELKQVIVDFVKEL